MDWCSTKEERSRKSLKRLFQARDNVAWIRLVTSQEGREWMHSRYIWGVDPKGLVMDECGGEGRVLSRWSPRILARANNGGSMITAWRILKEDQLCVHVCLCV